MVQIKRTPSYVVYKMGKLLDLSVSGLDPLQLDPCFGETFADMAKDDTPNHLLRFVEKHFSGLAFRDLSNIDEVAAMAATRDVSMFASALTKFGVRLSEVPIIETLLVQLADKTQEVPSDTVFSYGPRNPGGARRRMFTSTNEEDLFIQSFTDGMNGLIVGLACLEALQQLDICDPMYPQFATEATEGIRKMSEAISSVRKVVSPEIFTYKLRPFFEPKTIRGKTYFAPGGAQMPITMVDLLLWGVGESDRTCLSYWNENFQYLPASYRSRIEIISRTKSIVQSVTERVNLGIRPEMTQGALESITALLDLLNQIIRFRAPHLGIAKANMKIRPSGAVGSGGYNTSILQHLITKTRQAETLLSSALNKLRSQ